MRICQHAVPEGGNNCAICGSTTTQIYVGFTCIWRDVADLRYGVIRPESALKLREVSCEATDEIHRRIQELYEQRTEAMNIVEE